MNERPVLYCFTKYKSSGPSSRYRTYQYLDKLDKAFKLHVYAGFGDWYLTNSTSKPFKMWMLAKAFICRICQVLTLPANSVVWIEYELFPYMPPFAEWYLRFRKIPYSLDYDDAIFHNYDQSNNWLIKKLLCNKIPNVIKHAHSIVTGSPYLTHFALQFNTRCVEIPTSVDVEKYEKSYEVLPGKKEGVFVIGWIGSRTSSQNLIEVREAFKEVIKNNKAELWLMGFYKPLENEWAGLPVHFFSWKQELEIPFLNTIDAGIMPLLDTPFNRGKCAFKLVQYMAAGKPTISTPLEANVKVNKTGGNLFASNKQEWEASFLHFLHSPENTRIVGAENQLIAKKYYSKEKNGLELVAIIEQMIKVGKQ